MARNETFDLFVKRNFDFFIVLWLHFDIFKLYVKKFNTCSCSANNMYRTCLVINFMNRTCYWNVNNRTNMYTSLLSHFFRKWQYFISRILCTIYSILILSNSPVLLWNKRNLDIFQFIYQQNSLQTKMKDSKCLLIRVDYYIEYDLL